MISSIKKYKNIILLLVLFLFAEYLRVVTEFLIDRSADNIVFCMIAMIWAVYLKRRIIEEKTQKVLLGLAMSIVVLFVVRICKYAIFDKNTILWYMYYLPLTTVPLLVFFMSRGDMSKKRKNAAIFEKCCIGGLVLLNLMILTNDLHQLIFRFTTPGNIDKYTYGIGYWITLGWIVGFTLTALYNLFRVCSLPQSRSKIWIPLIPMTICVLALVLDLFHAVPMVNNTKIYQFQEIFLFMIISIVEALIYIGIISSNDGYEEIFTSSEVNACITDQTNKVVYSSDSHHMINEENRIAANTKKVMIDDYTRLHLRNISGGAVYYTEDIKGIVTLNHKLEEVAEVISDENAMIEAENKLLADEAMYRTKNKLYDDIARIVRPQVLMIEECLEGCEREPERFTTYISKASVLNAYIKRRINLSLIAMENEMLSLEELHLAIAESLYYLKYSDVFCSIMNEIDEGNVDAKLCIGVYDYFEQLIEAYYDKMSALMVTIDEKKGNPVIRITIETTAGSIPLLRPSYKHEVYEEEDTVRVTISISEGGDL